MTRFGRDPRTLDKDLDRLSAAERAGVQSLRPLVRVGFAILFVAMIVVFAVGLAGASGQVPQSATLATIGAGVALAAYLALTIGANDDSNALSPAVGAGAIGLRTGLLLVAMAEIAGAVLLGHRVSATLSLGIVDSAQMLADGLAAPAMLAALLAAAIWINLATWAGAPVSTTHSVVGGIAGAGIAIYGLSAVNWGSIAMMAMGWVISPAVAGLASAALLAFVRARIELADDRTAAARRWLPWMMAAPLAFAAGMVTGGPIGLSTCWTAAAGLATGAAVWASARALLDRRLANVGDNPHQRDLFAVPLILSAVLMAFAHGANDASNVTAPLGLFLSAASREVGVIADFSAVATLAAGGGLALGAFLFGWRLVVMVGSRITRLNPVRAFCVSVGTGAVVLGASSLGLPVSTTHVAVGGVFGVGFYREWEDRRRKRTRKDLPAEERHRRTLVRRAHFRRIVFAWAITVPVSALLAALFAVLMV